MGDSTKVRALNNGEMNDVHVLFSDGGQLLYLGVNGEWPSSEAGILVSDNELGLTNAVNERGDNSAYSTPSNTFYSPFGEKA